MKYFFILLLFISSIPAFAESHHEYVGIDKPSFYELTIDEHHFSIPYQVDGNVIAMAVDQELTSFLIGLENTNDSIMSIDLKHNLISVTNNEFAVLVNGLEVNYEVVTDNDSSVLRFFVPEFTEEVEIIGTHVIPEFPLGVLIIFSLMIGSTILVSKFGIPFFRL